jgi:hypothetical protein
MTSYNSKSDILGEIGESIKLARGNEPLHEMLTELHHEVFTTPVEYFRDGYAVKQYSHYMNQLIRLARSNALDSIDRANDRNLPRYTGGFAG